MLSVRNFTSASYVAAIVFFISPAAGDALLESDRPAGDAGAWSAWHVHFHKEQRPLHLDTAHIAVFHEADDALETVQAALAQLELAEQPIEQWHVNWHLVTLPDDARGAPEVVQFTQALVDEGVVSFVSPVFIDDLGGPMMVTPDVLVRFEPHVDNALSEVLLDIHGAGEILDGDWGGMERAFRVRPDTRNGIEVLEIANNLAQHPDVTFAEPDMVFSGTGGSNPPNDPLFPDQWALHNTGQSIGSPCFVSGGEAGFDIRALDAWTINIGDPKTIVVVLDDGVQQDHPDINQIPGADFTSDGPGDGGPVNECDNHGTPVAGIITAIANNEIGIAGAAPGAVVASARPFISNTNGSCDNSWTSQGSWTVAALDWADEIGARVTNNSNSYGFQSAAIESKYAETRAAGIIHFASAGNDSSEQINYPASLSDVNALAALDRDGELAPFSNWGEGLAFSAPGRFTISTDRTGSDGYTSGNYTCFGGTSAASPYAAGVAALVVSEAPESPSEIVEETLQQSATDLGSPGYNATYGWGLVNAHQALLLIQIPHTWCEESLVVSDGETTFSTVGAGTTGYPEPSMCDFFGDDNVHADLWFTYEATCTGEVTASVCDSDFLTKIAVYADGCPAGPEEAIACDIQSCPGQARPQVTFSAAEDATYLFRIGGHNGAQGEGTLTIVCEPEKEPKNPGDLNGDGSVGVADLLILLENWGSCADCADCPADLTGSCTVGIEDLSILLSNWG